MNKMAKTNKIKIKSKLLKIFFNNIYLNGILSKVILDFSKEGLKVNNRNSSNTILVIASIDKENFSEYKELGNIIIDKVGILTKRLKYINDEEIIEIIEEYDDQKINIIKLLFKSKNSIISHLTLIAGMISEDINNYDIHNRFAFNDGIEIELSLLKNCIKYVPIYDGNELRFLINKNKLILTIGEDYKTEEIIYFKEVVKNKHCFTLNYMIFEIIKNLNGNLIFKLSLKYKDLVLIENNEEGIFSQYYYMVID